MRYADVLLFELFGVGVGEKKLVEKLSPPHGDPRSDDLRL
jgi:hypothetical protein